MSVYTTLADQVALADTVDDAVAIVGRTKVDLLGGLQSSLLADVQASTDEGKQQYNRRAALRHIDRMLGVA